MLLHISWRRFPSVTNVWGIQMLSEFSASLLVLVRWKPYDLHTPVVQTKYGLVPEQQTLLCLCSLCSKLARVAPDKDSIIMSLTSIRAWSMVCIKSSLISFLRVRVLKWLFFMHFLRFLVSIFRSFVVSLLTIWVRAGVIQRHLWSRLPVLSSLVCFCLQRVVVCSVWSYVQCNHLLSWQMPFGYRNICVFWIGSWGSCATKQVKIL